LTKPNENDGEPPATRDPSSLILRIGDVLEAHSDEIERAYRAYTSLTFIVGALALIVTLFVLAVWNVLSLGLHIIYGSLDAVIIGFLAYAIRAQRGFEIVDEISWEVDRFRFITTFELLPPSGDTPQERLWNALREASHISDDLKALPSGKVKFDAEVPGKSGAHYKLEIFLHSEPHNPLRRFLSKWTLRVSGLHFVYINFLPNIHRQLHEDQLTILVLRLENPTPLTKPDLEKAKKVFLDISKKLRDLPEHAVVVSASGFSEDALEYVKDEKSEIVSFDDREESTIMDLVVERADGSFEVAYYG